uniref:Bystin n=1 Tax=Spumella elongata TaxID=89044 RepID=A0A7S3HA64_9STRA|mmetsp:Transcript_42185/g.73361  ORF Transcript_42185/g.73361 Transcript_42185/m.73361 type:complete len:426 (+) Transcript_42185:45-1322(+)|eukprot:CAMPEP_0184986356 /NCGR_PEP_ID=MMETSP1098-20130426/16372_1 /TAXON_ID=89044 /ORGANISM="Spumella elongata, Strain CCAP 955/1" /LENGTH=425 /DNA_ID=CAMNT_0027510595 /DNA_START=45 /DNA_END=1322 /DNA_ORIENTATION=+
MKTKTDKKSSKQLRHAPLGNEMEKPAGKLRPPKQRKDVDDEDEDDKMEADELEAKIYLQAKDQRKEVNSATSAREERWPNAGEESDSDEGSESDEELEDGEDADDNDMVDIDDGYVMGAAGLTEAEEALVDKFLHANRQETRTLADIIMDKLQEKKEDALAQARTEELGGNEIPPKVVEVYTAVGKMLAHYRSGKLPKALKMLPHLKNWEQVLWLTRPDEWSPAATYASTRIFASNLNEKMAQRFLNLVLLEKCRDDIRNNRKLNYYYYLAIRKALYKPSAFYKGFLLPLAQSGTCTLREATIIGSALSKLSIPGIHSAAVLLRLAELNYSGSTSMFIKILLNKKYALPRRVIDALVTHFLSFERESRVLPVVWHQSLLVFVQRYKFEFSPSQRDRLKNLAKVQQHYQITAEVVRELSTDKKLTA